MGEKETVILLLSKGAHPLIQQKNPMTRPYHGDGSGRTIFHYAIARGHLNLVIHALRTIEKTYGIEARQLVEKLADSGVNMSFGDSACGVDGNNLMHYVQTLKEASAFVRCGFHKFNDRNSNVSRLAGSGDGKTWATLDTIRLCLDAGVDIFDGDSCKCPCSPGGCTISGIFSIDFPTSTFYSFEVAPGLFWSLEWVTLVEEHCGVEAAKRVLLSLLRRVKCDQPDIAIGHVCCHRGHGIAAGKGWRSYMFGNQPRPLADDDIADILDEESDFIDLLDMEMEELASDSLHSLRTRWMSVIKAKYDAHIEQVNKERAKYKPSFPTDYAEGQLQGDFQVDYKNDTYYPVGWPSVIFMFKTEPRAYAMTGAVSSYDSWLRYEHGRTDDYPIRDVRKSGWFERRAGWVKELVDLMELSADETDAGKKRLQELNEEKGAISKVQ
ncbi:hypothetical protein N658DRAFT_488911 [Parathielavia hyrcaniae]|uniref:Uncharacterized protein n=1 Tax=Parathielavia hyrcaniae TaxID=113614 RepID=A0AAN6PWA8_9PEZI|nr:hypothetical protein N658DRAFT_488911 [Parathielavia hyrcaniae]